MNITNTWFHLSSYINDIVGILGLKDGDNMKLKQKKGRIILYSGLRDGMYVFV